MAESELNSANRQARRKERTRGSLLDATSQLLLAKGVDALTVNDIVEHADVARGTFYVYFSSKEDAVWALLETILKDVDEYLKKNSHDHDDARYAKWVYIFQHIADHQAVLRVLIGEKGHISALRRMEAYIAQLMTRDLSAGHLESRDNVPVAFVAQYLSGALMRVTINWLEGPRDVSVDELAKGFFTLARRQFEADG